LAVKLQKISDIEKEITKKLQKETIFLHLTGKMASKWSN